jgi:hypothetical protein
MGRIAQVAWQHEIAKQVADLQKQLADALTRIEALEAKRGPGRPKVERDTDSGHRKV